MSIMAFRPFSRALPLLSALLACACGGAGGGGGGGEPQPTAEEARQFVEQLSRDFRALGDEVAAAGWVQATYITPDTQLLNARANERYLELLSRSVEASRRFDGVDLDAATARTLLQLRL